MHTTIIANGKISRPTLNLEPNTLLIAANGGARHCLELGIMPQVIIGDFDSLTEDELTDFEKAGVELRRFPADKDETDLELALDHALDRGATKIVLFGLLGGRWDMSFANLLLLAAPRFSEIRFQVVAGQTEIFLLRGGETVDITGQPGDTVSLIPLTPTVENITYEGLEWPLENAMLPFGSPRGVSNQMVGEKACLQLGIGTALIVITH